MDDLLSRVTIDPLAIKYPSRGETASAGLVAEDTVSGCLDNLDGRVTALEVAPAPSGNYDVTVTTALGAGDVGKVVSLFAGTATLYQGAGVPAGVLMSVDGAGSGVVRRWGAATCKFGAGLPSEDTLLQGDNSGLMVAAGPGSWAVIGRVLSYDGSGTGSVFITAISTYGMLAAS